MCVCVYMYVFEDTLIKVSKVAERHKFRIERLSKPQQEQNRRTHQALTRSNF